MNSARTSVKRQETKMETENKRNQSEMNAVTEVKTTLDGINSSLDGAEDRIRIRDLEDNIAENN